MSKWPKDNQTALIRFYGDPGGSEVAQQLVKVQPPFTMYYNDKPVASLLFHKKAAGALLSALTKIWDYYDHNQARINKLGISKTAGTYNPRKVRGSDTRWSNHAFAAAIDLNAKENGFNVAGNIPIPVIAAFKSEGASWGGDYKTRKDPMHFEFCDRGEPSRTFEEWLEVLGVVPSSEVPIVAEVPDFVTETVRLVPSSSAPTPKPTPKVPSAPVPPSTETVQGDPELWYVQKRLKVMKYHSGLLDGVWGGLTAGSITGFLNDQKSDVVAPTSIEQFHSILPKLKLGLSKAESEGFIRPLTVARAEATTAELAVQLPEVKAAKTARDLGFLGAVTGGVSAASTGVAKSLGDAVEWLNPLKEFVADLPWPVWVGLALGLSGALYYISRKSGEARSESEKAYREGERM